MGKLSVPSRDPHEARAARRRRVRRDPPPPRRRRAAARRARRLRRGRAPARSRPPRAAGRLGLPARARGRATSTSRPASLPSATSTTRSSPTASTAPRGPERALRLLHEDAGRHFDARCVDRVRADRHGAPPRRPPGRPNRSAAPPSALRRTRLALARRRERGLHARPCRRAGIRARASENSRHQAASAWNSGSRTCDPGRVAGCSGVPAAASRARSRRSPTCTAAARPRAPRSRRARRCAAGSRSSRGGRRRALGLELLARDAPALPRSRRAAHLGLSTPCASAASGACRPSRGARAALRPAPARSR